MDHLENIKNLIKSLMASSNMHLLILEGPHGFAKSYTVNQALEKLNQEAMTIKGSTTPVKFYNTLGDYPNSLIVMDDCSGLFEDGKTVSILKSATWGDGPEGARRFKWLTTSSKAEYEEVLFAGKFIVLCNSIPTNPHTEAMLSRGWKYEIKFDRFERIEALENSKRSFHKDNPDAHDVIDFILGIADHIKEDALNFRTIDSGVELKRTAGPKWKDLFMNVLPKFDSPKEVVRKLSQSGTDVKMQLKDFIRITGKSRRTFYNYRDELGLKTKGSAIDKELQ